MATSYNPAGNTDNGVNPSFQSRLPTSMPDESAQSRSTNQHKPGSEGYSLLVNMYRTISTCEELCREVGSDPLRSSCMNLGDVRKLEDNITALKRDLAHVIHLDSDFAGDHDGRRTFTEKHIKYFESVASAQRAFIHAQANRRSYEDSDAGTYISGTGASSTAIDVFDTDGGLMLGALGLEDLVSASSRASASKGRSSGGANMHMFSSRIAGKHHSVSPPSESSSIIRRLQFTKDAEGEVPVLRQIHHAQKIVQLQHQLQQQHQHQQQQQVNWRSRRRRGNAALTRNAESDDDVDLLLASDLDDALLSHDDFAGSHNESDSESPLEDSADDWDAILSHPRGRGKSTHVFHSRLGRSNRSRATSGWEDSWSRGADELFSLASAGSLNNAAEVAAAAVAAAARRGSQQHRQSHEVADMMQPYNLSLSNPPYGRSKSTHQSRQQPSQTIQNSTTPVMYSGVPTRNPSRKPDRLASDEINQDNKLGEASGEAVQTPAGRELGWDETSETVAGGHSESGFKKRRSHQTAQMNAMRATLGLIDSSKAEQRARTVDPALSTVSGAMTSHAGQSESKIDRNASLLLEQHRETQQEMTEELLEMSTSLKARVTNINKSLKEDAVVLDKIDDVFDATQPTLRNLTKRLSDQLWASGFNCCGNLALVIITVVVFWFTFLVIRFVPKF